MQLSFLTVAASLCIPNFPTTLKAFMLFIKLHIFLILLFLFLSLISYYKYEKKGVWPCHSIGVVVSRNKFLHQMK